MRAVRGVVTGTALAAAVVVLLAFPSTRGGIPPWFTFLGAGVAAVLAGSLVIMRESALEDVVKVGLFAVFAFFLLREDRVPSIVGGVLLVGPILGALGNRVGAAVERRRLEERGDATSRPLPPEGGRPDRG